MRFHILRRRWVGVGLTPMTDEYNVENSCLDNKAPKTCQPIKPRQPVKVDDTKQRPPSVSVIKAPKTCKVRLTRKG